MRFIADLLNARAIRFEDAGRTQQAVKTYKRAIGWDRKWSVPWFNLGLLYKRQGRWSDSLHHNERAVELNPSDEGAWWNLGIAATALGEWRKARAAWRSCGMDVPDGEEPPNLTLGSVPIRLNPKEAGEVVWCDRIDPARAIITNVPLPRSGHRFGDLLLHDGSREGSRVRNGIEVPVFNELTVLEPSHVGTFVVTVVGLTAADVAVLAERASAEEIEVEDWSKNIRYLCTECSEGRIEHEHEQTEEPTNRTLGVAALSLKVVEETLTPLIETLGGGVAEDIECSIPPATIQ